ncbi:MAG: efflux RND transporter periplasmic adaptor subunit [Planctomycetota bacterium]|jgi:Cu(I)/Ag(I) efflux system membrane fusion protein
MTSPEQRQPPPPPSPPRHGWLIQTLLKWPTALVIAAMAFGLGYVVRWGSAPVPQPSTQPAEARPLEKAQRWTCAMHPQIDRAGPGKCPLCGMDLTPVTVADKDSPYRLTLTESARRRMSIVTAPVERRAASVTVRMVGVVDYDETRQSNITAWVPGRLDRVFVDFTGVTVRKGQPMVELYSPELLAAQEELLQSIQAVRALSRSQVGIVRETARATVTAARDKLRLLGLTAGQIDGIVQSGKVSDRIVIPAPSGGVVTVMHARQGAYVKTGERIYTIADLSEVWVRLDAYESDLPWLRLGQNVRFESIAYPGQTFEGTISFIDPVLTADTRTVKVRVVAANPAGKLKPGMFVRATAAAELTKAGEVAARPGAALVPPTPMVVPVSAVLQTGKRAIVYVKVANADKPTYEFRPIKLGPRAGDVYVVRAGLAEGERVVIRGAFSIDSERQIKSLPSLMGEEGGLPAHVHPAHEPQAATPPPAPPRRPVPAELRAAMGPVLEAYFAVSEALAADQADQVAGKVEAMTKALAAVPTHQAGPWRQDIRALTDCVDALARAKDIQGVRTAFGPVSEQMAALVAAVGGLGREVHVLRCPMAFDGKGGVWLQADREVRNPYYGAAMYRCGAVIRTIPAARGPGKDSHGHDRH